MDGYGKYAFPSGKFYEGQYKNDLKDGYGTFRWPDGRVYSGWW